MFKFCEGREMRSIGLLRASRIFIFDGCSRWLDLKTSRQQLQLLSPIGFEKLSVKDLLWD